MKLGVLIHCSVCTVINAYSAGNESPPKLDRWNVHLSAVIAGLGIILNALCLSYFMRKKSSSGRQQLG